MPAPRDSIHGPRRRHDRRVEHAEPYAPPTARGAIGAALAALNVVLIVAAGRFIIYLAAVVPVFLLCGLFMLVSGEPLDRGYPAPMWSRWCLGVTFFGGILLGVALVFVLGT